MACRQLSLLRLLIKLAIKFKLMILPVWFNQTNYKLNRVTVDTTVRPKAIQYLTDNLFYNKGRIFSILIILRKLFLYNCKLLSICVNVLDLTEV